MLQKVSQTTLIVFLKNRANLLRNKKVGQPFRVFVMTYVIRKPVVKTAYTDSRINRHRRHTRILRIRNSGSAQYCHNRQN